ncbi:putative transcription factor MYB family [Dioscorea sansibarensis]
MQHGYGDEDASGCGVSGIHYSISNNPNPGSTPHYMQQQMQHLSYFNPIPVPHQLHLFQDLNEEEESSIKEPFWRPLDLDYKKEKDNYKIFSELEAICKPTNANAIAETDEKKRNKKKKKKKRIKKEQRLNSIVLFFESLTKKLIEHQEELHRKFLDAMERKEQERMRKQEAWMKQEAEKAMERAEEQAISSARVATIVSFLENITKESVKLPDEIDKENGGTIQEAEKETKVINSEIRMYSNRWPKAEVEALIGVRSKLEFMFKDAGVKGHLWEEVSSTMRRMGFNRSAKRCKEKWENINKYFRKTKESGKSRPMNSKTCPYYHQLDQLYSKSSMLASTSSELLDAIVVPNDEQASFKFSEEDDDNDDDGDDNEEDEKKKNKVRFE